MKSREEGLTLEKLLKAKDLLTQNTFVEGLPDKVRVFHYANCDVNGVLLSPDHPQQKVESFTCARCELRSYDYMAVFDEGATYERVLFFPKHSIVKIEELNEK
jgi:hypothetical protein